MRIRLFILCVLCLTSSAAAQWRSSVIVVGPGPEAHQRFGHVALRFVEDARDIDVCYDWGRFDFEDPDFFTNFVLGNLRYSMGPADPRAMIEYYRGVGREISEIHLNLPPDRVRLMLQACLDQDTDENRFYDYDYYLDNCSTRVRDLIDKAAGGAVKATLEPIRTGHSFGWHTRRLMPGGVANSLLTLPVSLAIGPAAETPLNAWQECFLPMSLGRLLTSVSFDLDGVPTPLVKSVEHLGVSPIYREAERPADWRLPAAVFGFVSAGLLVASSRRRRLALGLVAGVALFCSIGGLLLVFFWAFTRHVWIYRNENLLLISPIAIVLLAGIVRLQWRHYAERAAIVIAITSLVAAALNVTLGRQANGFAVLAFLPINLAVAFVMMRLGVERIEREAETGR